MLRFALKNMMIKIVQVILVCVSIILSCGTAVLAFNTSTQIQEGITSNAAYYSAIIGPSGSKTQLVMNTVYFTDSPVGTIPYEIVSELSQDNRVDKAVPFAMADNYKGFNIVGTTKDYFDISKKELEQGELFSIPKTGDEGFEIVVGYNVFKTAGLKLGQKIYTSHSVGDEHHTPFIVKGVLKETHSMSDDILYTHLKSIWLVHEEGEEEEGEEEHAELNNMVCSIIIKATNPGTSLSIVNEYNGKIYTDHDSNTHSLQAVEPMDVIRSVLSEADSTRYIVYALCAVILVMNIMIISVVTVLNMIHSIPEITMMRLIGISVKKINLLYLLQNSIIGFVSIALSFLFSRIGLLCIGGYAKSMGAVLNLGTVYPLEFVVMIGVFLISILPTAIATFMLSRKDGIAE